MEADLIGIKNNLISSINNTSSTNYENLTESNFQVELYFTKNLLKLTKLYILFCLKPTIKSVKTTMKSSKANIEYIKCIIFYVNFL